MASEISRLNNKTSGNTVLPQTITKAVWHINENGEKERLDNIINKGVSVGIATTEKAGVVKPDGVTITVEDDGTLKSKAGYIVFPTFSMNFTTGHLLATGGAGVDFSINNNGHLESEVL